ncbi:membrane dipeptidase [Sphingomonas sp. CGMCC 1.13654]|uniref:Membrane dipeptidase n=1 Tax=Sphingomonas chungangi TaxID=2683589 RepID=A0A838LBV2_9SPHN|nr:membrane dipeptidase [Sphingomonas chungangi]MVW55581.1 hypothetical protein [Sphingomonas chungangi]
MGWTFSSAAQNTSGWWCFIQQLGTVVCATRCSVRTAQELIDFSSAPVIFSHSNL